MHKLNLLPKEILENRKRKKIKLIGVFLFIAALIICIICYKWICYETIQITNEIENILSKHPVSIPNPHDKQCIDVYINQNKNLIDKYYNIEKDNRDWSDLINKILKCMSDKMTLTFLSISEDNHLILKGSSLETVFIARMLKKLEYVDSIDKVSLDLINHDNNLYTYEISAIIKSFY